MKRHTRATRVTTKKKADLNYIDPIQGQKFWMPTEVTRVAERLGWAILYVEQHPDASIIVTFGSGTGSDDAGHVWEMALDVVQAIDRTLNRNAEQPSLSFSSTDIEGW